MTKPDQSLRRRSLSEQVAVGGGKEFLAAVLDTMAGPVFVKDENHILLAVNKAFCDFVGRDREELLGSTGFQFFPPSEAAIYQEKDDLVMSSGKTNVNEEPLTDRSGVTHTILTTKVPFRDEAGRKYLVGMIQDVTEYRRALARLRESERRSKDFAEVSSDWWWETDRHLAYTFVSEHLHSTSGYSPRHLPGRSHLEVTRTAEDWPRHRADLEARRSFRDLLFTDVLEDRTVHLAASGKPVFDEGGRFRGYRGTLRDVTSEVEARRQAARNERLAALGQLTATVSHELRTPLGTISASLYSVLQRLGGADPRTADILARIDRNVRRCAAIIDQLLTYTHNPPLEARRVELDTWLRGVLEEVEIPPAARLVQRLEAGVGVEIDPPRMRQAVENVLNNAFQTLEGRGGGRVEVWTRARDGRLAIGVGDDGPGMPPEVRERVFEPLFSTRDFGIGLGLTIARQILSRHGGGIDIESTPGEGTTAVLWLPLRREDSR